MTSGAFSRDLGGGVTLIRLPLPWEGLRWTNAYAIRGDEGITLIDCGVDDTPTRDALESGLAEMGAGLEDVSSLIATHLHPDHMGLAHRLVAAGIPQTMHEAATDAVDSYNDWNITGRRLAELGKEHGAPPEFIALAGTEQPRPHWAGTAIVPDRVVKDGDQIWLDDERALTVIHTPGHDTAHICLVDGRTHGLYSGDHILPRATPVVMYGFDPDPLGDYLQSLARIEAMGIGLTYPAHIEVLERGSLRARQIILHHERRLGAMAQEVRATPKTAWQLVEAIFRPNLDPFQLSLAFAETLAHVEYLRLRDELERTQDAGVWYYSQPRRLR